MRLAAHVARMERWKATIKFGPMTWMEMPSGRGEYFMKILKCFVKKRGMCLWAGHILSWLRSGWDILRARFSEWGKSFTTTFCVLQGVCWLRRLSLWQECRLTQQLQSTGTSCCRVVWYCYGFRLRRMTCGSVCVCRGETKLCSEHIKWTDELGVLGVYGKIILKWIWKK